MCLADKLYFQGLLQIDIMRIHKAFLLIISSIFLISCTLIKESRNKKKLANVEYERQYEENEELIVWNDAIDQSSKNKQIVNTKPEISQNIVWYHPNEWWRIETDIFPVNKDSVKIRRFAPQYGFSGFINTNNQIESNVWNNWVDKNHWNSFGNSASHVWQGFIRLNSKLFSTHPEFLAEINGKRLGYGKTNKLCVTNLEVQKLFVSYIRNNIENSPNQTVYSIEPSDGGNHCECKKCSALGSNSNKVFHFSNIIAKEIKKSHPQKQLGILAYYQHSNTPTFKIEDNIKVLVAPNGFQTLYSPLAFLNIWVNHHHNLGLREYLNIPQWKAEQPRVELNFFLAELNIAFKNNLDMLVYEAGTSINGIIVSTLLSKMFMNPTLTWDTVFEKFLDDCFKDSKIPIERLLNRWNSYSAYGYGDIPYSIYDLNEAFSLAKDENEKSRIRDLMSYLHYNILYLDWIKDKNDKVATTAYFDYLYNSHNRNIVNVKGLTTLFASAINSSPEFKEKYVYEVVSQKKWIKYIDNQQIEMNFKNAMNKYPPKKHQIITHRDIEQELSSKNYKSLNTYKVQLMNKWTTQIYSNSEQLSITPNFSNSNTIAISVYNNDGSFVDQKVLKSGNTWNIDLPHKGIYTISQHRIHTASIELKGKFNIIQRSGSNTNKNLNLKKIQTSELDQNNVFILEPIK